MERIVSFEPTLELAVFDRVDFAAVQLFVCEKAKPHHFILFCSTMVRYQSMEKLGSGICRREAGERNHQGISLLS